MKVYVVTEDYGEYSQRGFCVQAVFTTRELADDYAAKMKTLPGIVGEYGAGADNEYTVEEWDVWEQPTERLMVFNIHEFIDPRVPVSDIKPRGYRTEEYAPVGYAGFWKAERDWEPESGWSTIGVAAPTDEEARATFQRLLMERSHSLA